VDTQRSKPPTVLAHTVLEARELEVLQLIAASPGPIGARELGRQLRGEQPSESTLNRILRSLDQQGLTQSDGRGRTASVGGRLLAEQAAREQHWQTQLTELSIRTLDDVRDLIEARRGLEREIARSVAKTATADDVRRLRSNIDEYERAMDSDDARRLVTINFHKSLVTLTPNRLLHVAATVLFDPRLDVLEQVLDIVTAGHGRTQQGPHEHDSIVEAIAAHDPDAAERAMVAHLDRLAAEVSADVSTSTRLAIELFLQTHSPTGTTE
jgi:GntR family transcriptional regulator, transcriptional repressor for pyruvate dehydrogenase complex